MKKVPAFIKVIFAISVSLLIVQIFMSSFRIFQFGSTISYYKEELKTETDEFFLSRYSENIKEFRGYIRFEIYRTVAALFTSLVVPIVCVVSFKRPMTETEIQKKIQKDKLRAEKIKARKEKNIAKLKEKLNDMEQ